MRGFKPTSLVVAALLLTSCTRTIDVPMNQLGSGSKDVKTPHRIHMVDGSEYSVRQFTVTDSTVVIENLNTSDPRYQKAELPIVLHLRDVRSVEKTEPRIGGFFVVAIIGLLCVALFVPVSWGLS